MITSATELDFDEDAEYPHGQCMGCGQPLTRKERRYYGFTCNSCEREDCERLEAWRHGAEDPELDALYSVDRRKLN